MKFHINLKIRTNGSSSSQSRPPCTLSRKKSFAARHKAWQSRATTVMHPICGAAAVSASSSSSCSEWDWVELNKWDDSIGTSYDASEQVVQDEYATSSTSDSLSRCGSASSSESRGRSIRRLSINSCGLDEEGRRVLVSLRKRRSIMSISPPPPRTHRVKHSFGIGEDDVEDEDLMSDSGCTTSSSSPTLGSNCSIFDSVVPSPTSHTFSLSSYESLSPPQSPSTRFLSLRRPSFIRRRSSVEARLVLPQLPLIRRRSSYASSLGAECGSCCGDIDEDSWPTFTLRVTNPDEEQSEEEQVDDFVEDYLSPFSPSTSSLRPPSPPSPTAASASNAFIGWAL